MKELILIAIGAALVNNVVLSQFLGICAFLGVSKKMDTAAGMGGAVIFVLTISSFVTSLIYKFILAPAELDYNKLRGTRCGTHQRTEGLHDSAGYGLRSGNRNWLYDCHGADGRPAGKDGVQRYPGVIQRNADRSSYGYADVNGIYGIFRNDLGGMKR